MKKTWISCIKEILTWHSWVDLTRPSLSQQLQPITFFQGHLLGRVKFPWNQNKEAWPRSIGESSLTWDSSCLATLPHSSICILLLKIYLFIIHMQRKFRNFYDVNVEMWNIPHRLTCLSPWSTHGGGVWGDGLWDYGLLAESFKECSLKGNVHLLVLTQILCLSSCEESSPHTPAAEHPPWPPLIKE